MVRFTLIVNVWVHLHTGSSRLSCFYHGNASSSVFSITDQQPLPRSFVCGRANYHHVHPSFIFASFADTHPDYVDECARANYDKMFGLVSEMRHLLQEDFPVEECDCTLVPIPATFFAPAASHTAATSDPEALALEWLLLDELLADRSSSLLLHEDEREALQACAATIRAQMESMIAGQLEIHADAVQHAQGRGSGCTSIHASASI
jgi:hypothetical protein